MKQRYLLVLETHVAIVTTLVPIMAMHLDGV